jgi:deoxyribodipyrimidine photo-lyase
MRTLLWFRGSDLRLGDQPAVAEAAAADECVAVFVLEPPTGRPNHRRYLLEALADLDDAISQAGGRLVVREGVPASELKSLAGEVGADCLVGIRGTDPAGRRIDAELERTFGDSVRLHDSATLQPPGTIRTGAGNPYSVFTPFARAFRNRVEVPRPEAPPTSMTGASIEIEGVELPRPDAASGFLRGGESAAGARLREFLTRAAHYDERRDRMDLEGTSRLSADLKFGTLSVREVWHAVGDALGDHDAAAVFQNELLWREFNASTLWDRPELLEEPFRATWAGFPWRDDEQGWAAWVEGRTGYPVVDASSRQLLAEGFVHNRARMISASFLTKHLLVDYARGEAHYMEHLIDGDPAQNVAGWQWSAGCGCDAQPWFRIFNPITQGKKFDPDGDYVRRWIPELANLPTRWIHEPWNAPPLELASAGIRLGADYPDPVVDHREARERFLRVAKSHLG